MHTNLHVYYIYIQPTSRHIDFNLHVASELQEAQLHPGLGNIGGGRDKSKSGLASEHSKFFSQHLAVHM